MSSDIIRIRGTMSIKSQARVKASTKVIPHIYEDPLRLGAINLIEGCLGDVFGKTVLVVAEDPDLGGTTPPHLPSLKSF